MIFLPGFWRFLESELLGNSGFEWGILEVGSGHLQLDRFRMDPLQKTVVGM